MSYQRTEVNQFKGLNSSVDPALIEDGFARDIVNFRMEKVGKLVSRDGYVFGLFGRINPNQPQVWRELSPTDKFFENNGIIGIGELILSSKWTELDTDRLMVYMVRTLAVDSSDEIWDNPDNKFDIGGYLAKSHRATYLFSPMTGDYTNLIIANYSLVDSTFADATDPTSDAYDSIKAFDSNMDAQPQGKYETTKPLFAANKNFIERTLQNSEVDFAVNQIDHWIKHYVEMNQYRGQLVVSDKINGDHIIEDEANRSDHSACLDPVHSLHIRPNCLHEFDIDIVDIDLQMEEGELNRDVKQGMALYKFQLPKMTQMTSNNLCTGEFSDIENYPEKVDKSFARMRYNQSKAFLSFLQEYYHKGDTNVLVSAGKVYNSELQLFTNADNNSEVDNLLGKLEFATQEYVDEDGEFVEDAISDVFVWEEYQIPYYICSGKEEGFQFYRELDRLFVKTSNAPRIKELTVKDEYGKRVPLGVWRYRFVWDFGDGIYSAPSADMNVPDILWSAVPDDDINQSPAVYQRHFDYADTDILKSLVDDTMTDIYTPYRQKLYPALVNETNGVLTLTELGKRVFDLKLKLYEGTQHRFGVKTATGYTVDGVIVDSIKPVWDILDYADFSTLIVLNPGETIQTKGIFWEGMLMRGAGSITDIIASDTLNYDYGTSGLSVSSNPFDVVRLDNDVSATSTVSVLQSLDNALKYRLTNFGYLIVPMFPTADTKTMQSIFDIEGRLRKTYRNAHSNPVNVTDIYSQLIIPGTCPLFNVRNENVRSTYHHIDNLDASGRCRTVLKDLFNPSFELCEIVLGAANVFSNDMFNRDSNVYFNVVSNQEGYSDHSLNWNVYKLQRPFTLLRGSTDNRTTLVRTASGLRNEAVARLVLQGITEYFVVMPTEYVGVSEEFVELFEDPSSDAQNILSSKYLHGRDNAFNIVPNYYHLVNFTLDAVYEIKGDDRGYVFPYYDDTWLQPTPYNLNNHMFNNLDVRVYIPGTRFIGIEQLTSYFPSSLIHKAPRLGLKIDAADVPKRAKGVKIFRTLATHNNDWDPLSFGLVDTLQIERDENGNPITKNKEGDETFEGVFFFDDVMDANLNFGDTPDNYDGMRRAIRSRFNVPLNERMYYANFTEIYQSLAPRLSYNDDADLSTNWVILNGTAGDEGYDDNFTVQYKYAYINEADQYSPVKTTEVISITGTANTPQAVVLYLLPSRYDGTIKELHVFRAIGTAPFQQSDFKFIGKVLPEDEGIFVDAYKEPGKTLDCITPDIQEYEDGLRWSEPFQPDWIKLNNFAEFRSGDNKGVRITGLTVQYGNLLIFKENSMHRAAVQAEDPPISRTDEIVSNIGCIAPNTIINIDNMVYFLSSKGFMMYDNNIPKAMDGHFGEELQYILAHNPEEYLREATCGYNPYHKELYLNIPMAPSLMRQSTYLKDNNYPEWTREAGVTGLTFINNDPFIYTDVQNRGTYESQRIVIEDGTTTESVMHDREILGHIYVLSLEKQYVTKFAYTTTGEVGNPKGTWDVRTIDPRQVIRKYYTNSLGEMRSADIIPRGYGKPYADDVAYPWVEQSFIWAGMYIESPYLTNRPESRITYDNDNDTVVGIEIYPQKIASDKDMILDATAARDFIMMFGQPQPLFPPFKWMSVECEYRSKLFTGNTETMMKRIRKGLLNIFSKGEIKVRSVAFHNDGYDDRTEHFSSLLHTALQEFLYPPTVDNYNPYDNLVVLGTNTNIISFIPRSEQVELLDMIEDRYGKAVRYSIEVRASGRTQLNSVVFHWRPIHTYLQ